MMLIVVVLLALVVATMGMGFTLSEPAPRVATDVSFEAKVDEDTGITDQYVVIEHLHGEPVDPEGMNVFVSADGTQLGDVPLTSGDSFAPGDELTYDVDAAKLCSSGADTATLRMAHEPSGTVIVEQRIEIDRDATFSIEDNAVTSDAPFTATVTIPGSGYATLEGDKFLYWPFESRISIVGGGSERTLTPWPDGDPDDALTHTTADDLNNPVYGFPYTYTTGVLDPDKTVTVEMRSYVYRGHGDHVIVEDSTRTYDGTTYDEAHVELAHHKFTIDSSDPNEDNVKIYENGEKVPNAGTGNSHQTSLHEMLGSRLDDDARLQLDENEFVAVYDLNQQPSNADFNDVAAVIEVNPQPTFGSTQQTTKLYCG